MLRTFARLSFWTIVLIMTQPCSQAAGPAHDYPIQPVPFTAVQLNDTFWAPRLETNRVVTIPFALQKNEETGRNDNFRIAARLKEGKYSGERYNDTDVYKVIEGASYSLAQYPDPALVKQLEALVDMIAKAQEPDGYLYAARTCDPKNPPPGTGPERWVEENISHELYDMGHMIEAAVAHYQATSSRKFLDVAIKCADLIDRTFGNGPGKRPGTPGHQEIEIALAKLYRVTGDERYLKLAKYFLDSRGNIEGFVKQYPTNTYWKIYNDATQIQAHKPVLEQDEAVGHAVRATYMYSGMADVAALTGNEDYIKAIDVLWDNVVGKKMYLTGGIGSRHEHESFGAAFELPNDTGYNETCAAIGNAFWNERLYLLHGDAKYIDVLERVAYNGLISGVSLCGDRFLYVNPLSSDGKYGFNEGSNTTRSPWFETACCPGNVTRFLPSFPGYIYARKDDTLFVNLFVANKAKTDLAGRNLNVIQETRYPWDGDVRITLEPEAPGKFTVAVRIPGWARGEATPGGLYRFLSKVHPLPELKVNGKAVEIKMDKGYAQVRQEWKLGDTIELHLPMPVERVVARNEVKPDKDMVALQRGPIVYCAEWPDQPSQKALNIAVLDEERFTPEWRPDLLGGVTLLKGRALALSNVSGHGGPVRVQPFLAIPYYAWANRGPGEMTVWFTRANSSR